MIVVSAKPLSDKEKTFLDFLDAMIEEKVTANPNSWVEAVTPPSPAKIINALKGNWQRKRYGVGVFTTEDADVYRIVLSPPSDIITDTAFVPSALSFSEPAAPAGKRLLVRLPTRGRPEQAVKVVTAYRAKAGCPITIEVVIDEDDASMNASHVLQRLAALGSVITASTHRSKIEAVNGGRVKEWDILLLASDDMVPVKDGYASRVIEEMEKHFPHLDGAIFFDDGYAHERCCTLPIFGRRLYDQFGYVYEPEYKSLCCDVEQTEILAAMKRLVYVPELLIEHRHPATGKAVSDELYDRNEVHHGPDREIYDRRRLTRQEHSQFGFNAPPMALSILIASTPARRHLLDRLIDHIYYQIIREAPRQVEVLVDSGDGDIGTKRQRLLGRALGHYVAFIDDDDWVSYDYVRKLVAGIRQGGFKADCMSLEGQITTDGGLPKSFDHSIKHKTWSDKTVSRSEASYCRTPNHLNAVRRDIASVVGFAGGMTHGEDFDYSTRLRPLLSTEVEISGPLYHYWYVSKP